MKSSILIVSYLWKDTWKRWFEQPSSPLARVSVTLLLTAVATAILVAFSLLERNLRERLEAFGLNTLLIRETLAPDAPYLFLHDEGPDFLASLGSLGKKLRVRQLYARAQSEWQNELPVLTYPPSALPALGEFLALDTPLLCFSERLPAGAYVQVKLNQRSALAYVRQPRGWLRSLAAEDILLAPQGMFPAEERMGCIDVTLYERSTKSPPMTYIIAAIEALYANDQRPFPQLQSALPLIRDWEELHRRQGQWQTALAGILGGALALVYGAIAVLEFRQNLYVTALLRSFGASRLLLYARHWVENALLANGAAVAAVFLVAVLHTRLFATLGVAGGGWALAEPNPYLSPEILAIFLWVNAGALLSSLPIAIGLRQTVGTILN